MSSSSAPPGVAGASVLVIVTGTDPATARGGIGVAMNGYLAALRHLPVRTEMLPTYRPASIAGKFLPWLRAMFRLPLRLRAARREGLRTVVYAHCGALPSMLRESCLLLAARIMGAGTVLQVHAPEMDRYLRGSFQRRFVKLLFRPALQVCALTPWWADRMARAGVCRDPVVIANPLPETLAKIAGEPLSDTGAAGPVRVLIMARLVAGKGADIVIRAMAGIGGQYRLTVAGDGPEKAALEKLGRELGVAANVHFAGWVSGVEKLRLLRDTGVYCLPSTNDVFPMGVVEAMANGKPVVAARWGGLPDLVVDEKTGLLCPIDDPDAVRAALQRLADPALRHAMGERAKKRIVALSGSATVAAAIAGVLERVAR